MEIEEKLKAIQDQKGNNLYEHLLNTIGKLVQDHPNNAYEVFEEYSHFVKQNNYKYNDTKNYLSGNKIQEKYSDVQEYLQSMSQYFVSEIPVIMVFSETWIFILEKISKEKQKKKLFF